MSRRNRRLYLYKVQTAAAYHTCLVCQSIIEPGDRYTGRRKKFHTGRWGTLAKCSECVPIEEGEQ